MSKLSCALIFFAFFLLFSGTILAFIRRGLALKKLKRELGEDALRLSRIGNSTGKIIHDMNNPLHHLSLLLPRMESIGERCQASSQTGCPLHDKMDSASANIMKLKRMVSEILDIARGGRAELVYSKVDFRQYMESLVEHFKEGLSGKESAVAVSLGLEDVGQVELDTERFGRIMENLLKNASEALAGQKGGRIEICCHEEGQFVIASVSDNGPGIPKEAEENIFRTQWTSGKIGGTGFGLLICKEMAELHGGKIDYATSEKGTVFYLKIPKERQEKTL